MSAKATRKKTAAKAGARRKAAPAKKASSPKARSKTRRKVAPRAATPKKSGRQAKTAKRARPSRRSVPAKRTRAVAGRKTTRRKAAARRRLSPKELERYRSLLRDKREELAAAYSLSRGDSRSDLDDGTEDYIDYAVHSYAKDFLLSLSELERRQLFLVDEALERIATREYGHCRHCGRKIAAKRLEVAPWARYCVPCQELEEKGLLPRDMAQGGAKETEKSDDESDDEQAAALEDDDEDFDEDDESEEDELEAPGLPSDSDDDD